MADENATKVETQAAAAETTAAPTLTPELLEQFHMMRDELNLYRTEREAAARAKAEGERAELLKKGQLDEIARNHAAALKAKDDALEALSGRVRKSELTRALTEALSGHDLREGALGQLLKLWGDEFEVDDSGDGFSVRSKLDLRTPKEVFAERLKSAEFDHFLKASHRGGSGAGTAQGQAAAAPAAAANPFAFVAQQMREKYVGGNRNN